MSKNKACLRQFDLTPEHFQLVTLDAALVVDHQLDAVLDVEHQAVEDLDPARPNLVGSVHDHVVKFVGHAGLHQHVARLTLQGKATKSVLKHGFTLNGRLLLPNHVQNYDNKLGPLIEVNRTPIFRSRSID